MARLEVHAHRRAPPAEKQAILENWTSNDTETRRQLAHGHQEDHAEDYYVTDYVRGISRTREEISPEIRKLLAANTAAVDQLPAKGPIHVRCYPMKALIPEE